MVVSISCSFSVPFFFLYFEINVFKSNHIDLKQLKTRMLLHATIFLHREVTGIDFCMQPNRFSLNIWRYWHEAYTPHTWGTQCHFACWHMSPTSPSPLSFSLFKENNSRGCQISEGSPFMTIAFSSGVALCFWGGLQLQICCEMYYTRH